LHKAISARIMRDVRRLKKEVDEKDARIKKLERMKKHRC